MDRFIVIEIGSTNTKAYRYDRGQVEEVDFKTIEFKNHYKRENCICEEDKKLLFDLIEQVREEHTFVFGTSIFRNLDSKEKDLWLSEFYKKTGIPFHVVTADMENELTVFGATSTIDYADKIGVMIGGGGSTELSIVQNGKIIEKANSSFGAMDVCDMFPELRTDYATSEYSFMLSEVKKLVTQAENKVDLLILAGGDYLYFYEELRYPLVKNQFYENSLQPYVVDVEVMDSLDKKFFYKESLEEICLRTHKDGWWRGARGMRLCVKVIVDMLGVKYIVPTRISMVYGIVEKIKKNEI